MRLADACEPLFQYVCRLNRSARKGVNLDASQVRSEVMEILGRVRSTITGQGSLARAAEEVELILMFFVDSTVRAGSFPFKEHWKDLAYEKNELAGDERFWDLLDEALADNSEIATEKLGVFYTCVGLGFTGWFDGQPEHLRQKMLEMSSRLRGSMETDETARVCPEAYEHVRPGDFDVTARDQIIPVAFILVGLMVVVFIANVALFFDSKGTFERAFDELDRMEERVVSSQEDRQ